MKVTITLSREDIEQAVLAYAKFKYPETTSAAGIIKVDIPATVAPLVVECLPPLPPMRDPRD